MRKRLVDIFLKVTNKLMVRMRAGKRLIKIKQKISNYGAQNREDVKRMVAEDWREAQNARIGGDEEETNIHNVKFAFNFDENKINGEIRMPVEYDNIANFIEKIEVDPVTSFDDLVPFEHIPELDFEVMEYKPFPLPPVSTYEPTFAEKPFRPGCQYESTLRQIAGEPDLEKIQMQEHEQMELLKKKEKAIVSGANVAMPKTFLKPLDYSIDLLLRPHPTLRKYEGKICQYNETGNTEVDPEYHLHP